MTRLFIRWVNNRDLTQFLLTQFLLNEVTPQKPNARSATISFQYQRN